SDSFVLISSRLTGANQSVSSLSGLCVTQKSSDPFPPLRSNEVKYIVLPSAVTVGLTSTSEELTKLPKFLTRSLLKALVFDVSGSGSGFTKTGVITLTEAVTGNTDSFVRLDVCFEAELVELMTRRQSPRMSAVPKKSARFGAINRIVISYVINLMLSDRKKRK